ncbi:MAG TPA: Crp/Fnr family transcriptional regulator [Acidimicrobiales bacterium]
MASQGDWTTGDESSCKRDGTPAPSTVARIDALMEWALLAVLTEHDRRELLSHARRRRFAKGEAIFHEGDPGESLHLVASGHVAVRLTTPLGDQTTLRIIGAGGWFGELALLLPAPRNATIIPLDPVETLVLHRDQIADVRERVPAFDHVVANALVIEVRRLSVALLEALFVPADKRILRRLADLAGVYGFGEGPVVIPLTQDEVAQLAGTTRPTVNKVLQAAAAAGLVNLRRGQIEIYDAAGLARRGH